MQNRTNSPNDFEFCSSMPTTYMLETVLACNLRCPDCAIGGEIIGRPKGILKYDKFLEVVEKIRPYAQYIYLHIWGEPTMNKRIFDMISVVAEFARVNISTNGLLLDAAKCQQLIDSGVSDLIISIDGVSQEVYENYRVGGDARKALDTLAYLSCLNRKREHPINISPQFIVFRHNQHEAMQFAAICEMLGLKPSFKAPYLRGESRFEVSDIASLQRPSFDSIHELKQVMATCNDPRNVFTILNDGSCVVCCHDYDGKTSFGNIFQSNVEEIWNCPAYMNYRQRVCSGNAPDFCVNECMTWTLKDSVKSKELIQIGTPST